MLAYVMLFVAVSAQAVCEDNLIVNGDFESGNTGFTSEYDYSPSDMYPPGKYTIDTSPKNVHSSWADYGDNTSGSGNMLIVNAACNDGGGSGCSSAVEVIWEQTVTVNSNTPYVFRYYLSSSYPVAPAQIQVTINGSVIGTDYASSNVAEWDENSYTWNSESATSATIVLKDLTRQYNGDDFAIDDISFRALCQEVDLCAGQDTDIGEVIVVNDENYLYVTFVSSECMIETHLHVAGSLADIPTTKKGNPIPGQFEHSEYHGCSYNYTYTIPLASLGTITDDIVYIAAHAALGQQEFMTIVSGDGNTMVTQRRSGNDAGFTAVSAPAVLAWEPGPSYPNDGPDDSSWESWSLWDQRLSINLVPTGADWIWESYRVNDPVYGTVLTFERTFDIGYPMAGNLRIACDNGYEVFLNSTSLGSDNVYGEWRTSNLKQAFVDVSGWDTVGSYDLLTYLNAGTNTLTIDAANEYFNTDDSGNPGPGTESSNPGACIFALDVDYLAEGETAWGAACGEGGHPFPDAKNWATYFAYTLQVINGE